jgi:PhnB protein
MADVKPIPDGYHAITPYLYIKGAAKAIQFYTDAFGATERMRMDGPNGSIGHAELEFGDSVVMLADAPERAADARNGVTASLMLYVPDADATFKCAIDAGATQVQPLENKFYGDRSGTLRDPFGQEWSIATHIEDVSPEEMGRRMAAMPAMS